MGKSRITLILTLNSQPFVFCLCCMPPIPTNRIKIPRNPVFHFTIRQNQKRKVGRFLRLRRDHSIHISGLVQPIYIQNSEVPPTAPSLTHAHTHTPSSWEVCWVMVGDGHISPRTDGAGGTSPGRSWHLCPSVTLPLNTSSMSRLTTKGAVMRATEREIPAWVCKARPILGSAFCLSHKPILQNLILHVLSSSPACDASHGRVT